MSEACDVVSDSERTSCSVRLAQFPGEKDVHSALSEKKVARSNVGSSPETSTLSEPAHASATATKHYQQSQIDRESLEQPAYGRSSPAFVREQGSRTESGQPYTNLSLLTLSCGH